MVYLPVSSSTTVPVMVVLSLNDPLIVSATRLANRRGRNSRRGGKSLRRWFAFQLIALPLDLTDAVAALASNVFRRFNKTENIFLGDC